MLPLLLFVFWLGLRMLNYDVYWYDEIRALNYASDFGTTARPITEIWQRLAAHKWQSPGFYILLSLWGQVAGWEMFSGRLLPLLLGILALAVMYRLGRDAISPRVGLFAAGVLAGSSLYIYYLHEMRPYALHLLLTCASVWAYWYIISRKREASWYIYIVFFLSLTGLAYTHAMALLTPMGIGLYHLVFAPKNQRWWRASVTMALAACAALPWLFVTFGVGYDLGLADRAIVDTERQELALFGMEIPQTLLYAFSNGNSALVLVLMGFAALNRQRITPFAWLWIVVVVCVAMVVSYFVPAFVHIKYLMAALPAMALLLAIGIDFLAQKRIPTIVILVVWLVIGTIASRNAAFHETLKNSTLVIPREGFMQMVDILEQAAQPNDVIILHGAPVLQEWNSGLVYRYYLQGVVADHLHLEMLQEYAVEVDEELYMQVAEDVLHNESVVWVGVVPRIPQTFRSYAFFKQLDRTHSQCQAVLNREDIELSLYAQSNAEIIASFGDGLVEAQALWEIPQTASGTLDLLFGWQRDVSLPPDTYSASIRLENTDGELVSQVDYGLSNSPFSCRWSTLDLAGLAAGEYTLKLVIYNWQTLERMSADETASDNGVVVQSIRFE
jgi:uncharacterized membrane protein